MSKEIQGKNPPEADKIDEILTRGVAEVIDPDGRFREKLRTSPKEIVIKYGVDPTRPDIHLGHAACLRKLVEFRKLGCQVIFLIGDFTAKIGDPTGKSAIRPELELDEIHKNGLTYVTQAKRIFGNQDFAYIQNSTWFMPFDDIWVQVLKKKSLPFFPDSEPALFDEYVEKRKKWETEFNSARQFITLSNVINNLRNVTADQIIEREMFKKRKKNKAPIYMSEFIYPVLQGIDSVVIAKWIGSCDLEMGGTDQYFNMLMGRQIMERSRADINPQAVLTVKILEGTDGREKMSKSLDNYIAITEKPNDMFGKVMSVPDSSMLSYFELCTDLSLKEAKKEIENNPRDAKIKLATEIAKIYHGEGEAEKAKKYFIDTFSKKEIPELVPEWVIAYDAHQNVIDFMVSAKLATSRSDARRKIEQGGVSIDGEKVPVGELILSPELHDGKVMKVGKFHFVRIKFKKS